VSARVRVSKMTEEPRSDHLLNELARWADPIDNVIVEREPDAVVLTFIGEGSNAIDYASARRSVEDVLRATDPTGWTLCVRIDEP
jgi:hypothetical protein